MLFLLHHLRRLLDRPWAVGWVCAMAAVLVSPGLLTGRLLDDYTHVIMLEGSPQYPELVRAPWDLYAFIVDDAHTHALLRERGSLPWFTDPGLHATLFRPLSSLTLYVDSLLWDGSMVLRHLHSVAWLIFLIFVVSRLYRRLLASSWLAGLATLLYALDDTRGFATTWIANRNVLIGTAFGAAAILLHVRWREEQRARFAIGSCVALAAGLLASEVALGLAAYVFVYAFTLERATLRGRVISLIPAASLLVAWAITYKLLGYGAGGSGMYVDPGEDPVAFVFKLLERAPVLWMSQLTPFPCDAHVLLTFPWNAVHAAFAAALVVPLLWIVLRVLKRSPMAMFLMGSMVLSTVPVAAVFPNDRLLFGPGIGAAALVAMVLGRVLEQYNAQRVPPLRTRALAGFLVATHLVLAPLLLPLKSYSPQFMVNCYNTAGMTLDRLGELEGRTLIVVNGPDFFMTSWPPIFRHVWRKSVPERIRVLGSTQASVKVSRIDDRTLRLEPADGFLSAAMDTLLRSPARPFVVGERHAVSDLVVEVLRLTDDGRPAEIECSFNSPLEDPRYVWAAFAPDGYHPFGMPKIGETVVIAPISARHVWLIGTGQVSID